MTHASFQIKIIRTKYILLHKQEDIKMNVYEGSLVSQGIKVGIVAARFNEFIVSKLVSGALDVF